MLLAASKLGFQSGLPQRSATPNSSSIPVGLGDLQLTQIGELVAYSLRSCIALCLYDPRSRTAAMAHIVLPDSPPVGAGPNPGKFADTAVPAMLAAFDKIGCSRLRLQCKLAGGAAVLAIGGGGTLPNIGKRNLEAVRAALSQAGITILGEATGGNQGR